MLLTRSIRRKLATSILVVAAMFLVFVVVSLQGLRSYRRTVQDLEISIASAPSNERLIDVLSHLLVPFHLEFPSEAVSVELRADAADYRKQQFAAALDETRIRFDRFERAWRNLPGGLRHDPMHEMAYNKLLDHVDEELRRFADGLPQLSDPDRHHAQSEKIVQTVAQLIDDVHHVPDPSNMLGERLQVAKADYQFYFRAVIASAVLAFTVLTSLVVWGQWLISRPIHRLWQGVSRVASGDFDHEIDPGTTCEVSDLANAFNQMTRRIRSDQADKERQIEERSRQLVQSERLVGVGFLAAGVAHEINNPLTAIMTAAEVLGLRINSIVDEHLSPEDAEDVREYLRMIRDESRRCEAITKKLLDFSHGSDQQRNLYDVTAIVQEVIGMVKHLSQFRGHRITLNRTDSVYAWVSGPEIKQVILNLVANGLDATDDGGQLSIEINQLTDQVELLFRDDGCGMTAEQMNRIFEPFFSTKAVGKGTGLGLSISRRIVVDHAGTLDVKSDGKGQGSTFRLCLPRTELAARNAA